MIKFVKLTNHIGYGINVFGFKVSLVLGYRERYYDPPLQVGVASELKSRNVWFRRPPPTSYLADSCSMNTACQSVRYARYAYSSYKMWRGWGYSLAKTLKMMSWRY